MTPPTPLLPLPYPSNNLQPLFAPPPQPVAFMASSLFNGQHISTLNPDGWTLEVRGQGGAGAGQGALRAAG